MEMMALLIDQQRSWTLIIKVRKEPTLPKVEESMSEDEETLKQRASSLKREATEQQSVLYFSLETKANLSLQLENSSKKNACF